MERPSGKELYNKIKLAKAAVSNDQIQIINSSVIAADAIELGYQVKNLKKILLDILKEIGPNHYVGSRPPQKSYESKIRGKDLFAFKWLSKRFGCETYLKFSIKKGPFYLVSLHQNRERTGG